MGHRCFFVSAEKALIYTLEHLGASIEPATVAMQGKKECGADARRGGFFCEKALIYTLEHLGARVEPATVVMQGKKECSAYARRGGFFCEKALIYTLEHLGASIEPATVAMQGKKECGADARRVHTMARFGQIRNGAKIVTIQGGCRDNVHYKGCQ